MSRVAELLLAQANAQAEAARQKGAIWGGALSNIGQSIAAIPGQMQQQKHQDALMLLEQARAAREAGDHERATALFHQSQQVEAARRQIVAKAIKPDGTWDASAATATGQEIGMPDVALDLNEKYNPPPKWENVPAGTTGGTVSRTGTFTPAITAPEKVEAGSLSDYVKRQRADLATTGETETPAHLLKWTQDYHAATRAPESMQTKAVLLDGQPAEVVFNPKTGKWQDAAGTDVSARVKPMPSQSPLGDLYADIDPKAIAAAIRGGTHPPDIAQYGRPASAAISSILAQPGPKGERPFNLSAAQREWKAQLNLNRTMNGAQQVRLDESIRSGLAMYDRIDAIADQWNGKGWGPLSRLNLEAARQGVKGPEAQKVAVELTGQIGQLTSDVATIEQGGLTPTVEARKVAEQSLQDWWGRGTIKAMTDQGRANMQIRHLARQTQEPLIPGNAPSTAPALPATPAPQTTEKIVTLTELAAVAKQRGTTVDQERARYINAGYAIAK